jgi:WD40 repeat protein
VLTAGVDATLRLWDSGEGTSRTVTGQAGSVGGVAFSPDGRLVVSPVEQHATVFDAESGEALAAMHGHDGLVRSATFSPDGTRGDGERGRHGARLGG